MVNIATTMKPMPSIHEIGVFLCILVFKNCLLYNMIIFTQAFRVACS